METIMMITLGVLIFIVYFFNTFMCMKSDSKFEMLYLSTMFGCLLFLIFLYYSVSLSDYIEKNTIIKMENQEVKYEVTSIEPNTGKVLTIKLKEE